MGATCTSLNADNPCEVKAIVSNNKWENKILYMVNSNQKFVYNIDTDQDGVANYPTTSDGSITQTNGGSKSILVVTTAKSPNGPLAYARTGGDMKFSKRIMFIDRPTGATVSTSMKTNTAFVLTNMYISP